MPRRKAESQTACGGMEHPSGGDNSKASVRKKVNALKK